MRPGLAKRPQLGRSRGRQGESRRGESGSTPSYRDGSTPPNKDGSTPPKEGSTPPREGSTPPREGSTPPNVGDSVVSSGKTKSPSSGVLVSSPSSSSAAGRFTILGSMSETVDVNSGVTEVVAGDTDVLDVVVEVVEGDEVVVVVVEVVVVDVRGLTGSIGSPTPATAAS